MRIPVTTLDSYRLFRDYDFISQEEMINRINRVPIEPNEKMYLGSALHKILECPDDFRDGSNFTISTDLLAQGEFKPSQPYTFDGLGIHEILRTLPQGTAELKSTYEIDGVTLSGIVDLIDGVSVWDHKVSTTAPKPDNYSEAYQWRCYLEMFACDRFVYNHIQVFYNRQREFWEVKEVSQFEHYRYPAMRSDIQRLIADYLGFVRHIESARFGLERVA